MNELFFYKRGMEPREKNLKYYDHSRGIAGFNQPQRGEPYFNGTIGELEKYNKTRRRPSRDYREGGRL